MNHIAKGKMMKILAQVKVHIDIYRPLPGRIYLGSSLPKVVFTGETICEYCEFA